MAGKLKYPSPLTTKLTPTSKFPNPLSFLISLVFLSIQPCLVHRKPELTGGKSLLPRQKRRSVTVVEQSSVACAASGKAGGFLALDWCDDGPPLP
ncbi:putative oxidoreductase C1F5.03c [Bienertia sinuspersici]